ncbi:MAG: RluA family pseudouridine synthase [Paludibacteraceae bacterium]|nr:RluA family pseudouridine synthase [Paludibacteraceae bacterium]MBN2787168.1 RluA family pseudouridine synthase [Paludibacteraceae bacterium]
MNIHNTHTISSSSLPSEEGLGEATILYEDNHLIAINKTCSDLVQGDKTGDNTLPDRIKAYLKDKYNKPGNVFCGVTHRLDRPTSGVVIFAKTSKALARLNELFKTHEVKKTYWAIVKETPQQAAATLKHYLVRNEQQNKSYAYDLPRVDAKEAVLSYTTLAKSDNYCLLEVNLETGRHHQIRCQLAKIGCPIKGDLKYGFARSNPDGGISLHARKIEFIHPVSKEKIIITAPVPKNNLWKAFEKMLKQ